MSFDSAKSPISLGWPLITNTGRDGSARSGFSSVDVEAVDGDRDVGDRRLARVADGDLELGALRELLLGGERRVDHVDLELALGLVLVLALLAAAGGEAKREGRAGG